MLTENEYKKLTRQAFTHVPVIKTIDTKSTPMQARAIDIYWRLANQPYSYLFESVSHNEQWGRYSIIGLPCDERIRIEGKQLQWQKADATESIACDDPLHWLDRYLHNQRLAGADQQPPFLGGLVGFFGYDTVRCIETGLQASKAATLDIPDILLLVSNELLVIDHYGDCLYIIVCADTSEKNAYGQACSRIAEIENALQTRPWQEPPAIAQTLAATDFATSFGEHAYQQAVETARHYIRQGDVMQVVLSQCLHAAFLQHPMAFYKQLVKLNPSPYMFYLNLDDFYVVGSSPEILVRANHHQVTVRPIAGTRKRGKSKAEDKKLEQELLADAKELAEHLMLIDLGRNDLGRVCQVGSIQVTEQMLVERYSHVMHIVSHVNGRRPPDSSCIDILRATFPAGTVSGAPKVRAMELIDELEPSKRQVYSGAVGYLSWSGIMDTAIAIRTAVITNQRLYLQAGAGIVYDSVPEHEWQETLSKLRAMMCAAGFSG